MHLHHLQAAPPCRVSRSSQLSQDRPWSSFNSNFPPLFLSSLFLSNKHVFIHCRGCFSLSLSLSLSLCVSLCVFSLTSPPPKDFTELRCLLNSLSITFHSLLFLCRRERHSRVINKRSRRFRRHGHIASAVVLTSSETKRILILHSRFFRSAAGRRKGKNKQQGISTRGTSPLNVFLSFLNSSLNGYHHKKFSFGSEGGVSKKIGKRRI